MDNTDYQAKNEEVNQGLTRTGLSIERLTMLQEHMAASSAISSATMVLSISGLSKEYKELGVVLQVVGQITNMLFMAERMLWMEKKKTTAATNEQTVASGTAAAANTGETASLWAKAVAGVAANLWLAPVVAGIIAVAAASVYALSTKSMAEGGAGIAGEGETFKAHAGERYWFGGKNGQFPFPGGGTTIIHNHYAPVTDDMITRLEEYDRNNLLRNGIEPGASGTGR